MEAQRVKSNCTPFYTALIFLCTALLAGCGGGTGTVSTPVPVPSGGGITQPQSAAVQFEIQAPVPASTTSMARKPNFSAPAGTQSVNITLTAVNGTATSSPQPTTVNISATASGCTATSSTITCDVTVIGEAGTDAFTLTSYPQPNAKGTAIATGTASVNSVAGQTVTAPVTLAGTIASVALQITGTYVAGQSATIPVSVVAKDASGAQIMGTYTTPITISDSDTSGATALSATSVADSTAASKVTLSYTGASMASPATISAAVAGLASSNLTNATFAPNNEFAMQNGSTYSYAVNSTYQSVPAVGTPHPMQTNSATETKTTIGNASFNGYSNLFDIQSSATYTSGEKDATDSYFGWGASGSTMNVLYYGDTETITGTGYSETSSYTAAAPSTINLVPFAAGNTWSPGVAGTEHYVFAGLILNGATGHYQSGTRTYNDVTNSDGSFSLTEVTQTGDQAYTDTWTEDLHADGSATSSDNDSHFGVTAYSFGTPQPAPSGSGMVIPVSTGSSQASPAPAPSPTLGPPTLVPDWYPNGGAIPNPMQSKSEVDEGSVTLPSSCAVGSGIPATAEEMDETYFEFDPFGLIVHATTKYYEVPGIGTVCETDTTTTDNYDVYATGAKTSTSTSTFVESLTSDKLAAAMHAAGFKNALSRAGLMVLGGGEIREARVMQKARMEALRRLHAYLRHRV